MASDIHQSIEAAKYLIERLDKDAITAAPMSELCEVFTEFCLPGDLRISNVEIFQQVTSSTDKAIPIGEVQPVIKLLDIEDHTILDVNYTIEAVGSRIKATGDVVLYKKGNELVFVEGGIITVEEIEPQKDEVKRSKDLDEKVKKVVIFVLTTIAGALLGKATEIAIQVIFGTD